MGRCRFCNEKAGLFQDSHDACMRGAETSRVALGLLVSDAVKSGKTFADISHEIDLLKQEGKLETSEVRLLLISAADRASQEYAVHAPVTQEDFERIFTIYKGIGYEIGSQEIKVRSWYGFPSLALSRIMYRVLHGEEVEYDATGKMSFHLSHSEQPIFSTGRAILATFRDVASRNYYQSVGMPIGGGLYYRIGAATTPTHQTSLVPSDEGEILLTTEALYFGGLKSTFKIPYGSILRLEPFTDGIGVFQSHGVGKVFVPDYSGMEIGWFLYNVLTFLVNKTN